MTPPKLKITKAQWLFSLIERQNTESFNEYKIDDLVFSENNFTVYEEELYFGNIQDSNPYFTNSLEVTYNFPGAGADDPVVHGAVHQPLLDLSLEEFFIYHKSFDDTCGTGVNSIPEQEGNSAWTWPIISGYIIEIMTGITTY